MLKIYYGDAGTDREKFIFDQIDPRRKTILLVPDQSSLQTEQEALRRLGGGALMDLCVADFSSLGRRVVRETEGHDPSIIDKYGRHMLLTVLIERLDEELTVYRGQKGRNAFADQMNSMISEMKRYNVTPEALEEVLEQLKSRGTGNYLVLKLEDVLRIYRSYEETISGVYQDAEDYISYYADRIGRSSLVRGAEIWIYGFDTFTPKNLEVIGRLLQTAGSVSVVLTYEDGSSAPARARALTQGGGLGLFRLTDLMIRKLTEKARENGHETSLQPIAGYPRRNLWTRKVSAEGSPRPITLVRASSIYTEAESAAAFIQGLVRDEGYRYSEIAVLCNDMDVRGRLLLRTFDRWDIPAFADRKRKVLHQPVVSFLLSFLDVLAAGWSEDGIIGMIKSGLPGFSDDDEAMLENYVKTFRIRGSRWQKPFDRNTGDYTDEEMARLEEMRSFLVSVCDRAKDSIGRRNTAKEKVRGLAAFLQEDFGITERIGALVERQQEMGLSEGAAETAQIWNAICGIFEQIIQVIGEEKISNGLLREMIMAGLESLEIGLVPVSRDSVIIGTLQRSRPGNIRALVVVGANAGLLPMDMSDEGLLSRREKEQLERMQLDFAGRERITQMEEQLAIYRMFSLPEDQLYVSFSQSDGEGAMLRPSELFRVLQDWQAEVSGDLGERAPLDRIASRKATVPYLADAMREKAARRDPFWQAVLDWYRENDPEEISRLDRGSRFDNHREALGEAFADALYRGDRTALEVSASRLEKFSGCPFSHFVSYGLRAREERSFEVGGREIGDVYHQCLMEFSKEMQAKGRWDSLTEEECRETVARILQGSAAGYREGLFESDAASRFRMERIREICGDIAWALTGQVRSGAIRQMYFEEPFGSGYAGDRRTEGRDGGAVAGDGRIWLPAIDVPVGERLVRIRGIIDRMDVIGTPDGEEAVRIVDYKTGNVAIAPEDFASGLKLQMMIYMDAALAQKSGESGLVPAGVFYFRISDFMIDGDKDKKSVPAAEDAAGLERLMKKDYRMQGITVDDAGIILAMDEKMTGEKKEESDVIPVKYDPGKGVFASASGSKLLSREEFEQLLEATNQQIRRICSELYRGDITARPKRQTKKDRDGNQFTACTYCDYRSICVFDTSIPGCRYEDV